LQLDLLSPLRCTLSPATAAALTPPLVVLTTDPVSSPFEFMHSFILTFSVLVYMAKVADAKTATSGSFFKVAEDGYSGTTASWGTEILNANCGKRAFTVPKSIASGDYLVRAEVLALHAGVGNAQPYVSCFQVKVTGGGSATPAGVSFPGKKSQVKVDRAQVTNVSRCLLLLRPSVQQGHLRLELQVRQPWTQGLLWLSALPRW
jgi:hypothetical protein